MADKNNERVALRQLPRRWKSAIEILVLLLVAVSHPATAPAQVSCGDTITGKVQLTADLTCFGAIPALTINGGTVDLNRHQIICSTFATEGVRMTGSGSKLLNGSILGCTTVGVTLEGVGKHKVENVSALGSDTGFHQTSGDGNKYTNCSAVALTGFDLQAGAKTSLTRCTARADVGFVVVGTKSKLVDNVASAGGSPSTGFHVVGDAHKISRNVARGDWDDAFLIAGNDNKLQYNQAAGSTVGGGFDVIGDRNKIGRNSSVGNDLYGIHIAGDDNKVSKNTAVGSLAGFGIRIDGNDNAIGACTASGNGSGIAILGAGNALKKNVAMGNLFGSGVLIGVGSTANTVAGTIAIGNDGDLQDDNAACGTNSWVKNDFRTSEAGGVAGHSCIE